MQVSTLNSARKVCERRLFKPYFWKKRLKKGFSRGTPPIRLKIRHMLVLSGLKRAFLGLYKKGGEGGKVLVSLG